MTFDASGAAAPAIKSGQVIRLFLPKGTSVTVSEETPPNEYTVSYKDDNTAAAGDTEENFTADIDAADIQVINTYTIAEVEVDGYNTSISGSAETGFVISNSHTPDIPDTPDTPDEPDAPDAPSKPADPDEPGAPGDPDEPGKPAESDGLDTLDEPAILTDPDEPVQPNTLKGGLPQTGDTANLAL